MSIPKSERPESKFEILNIAKKIRNSVCALALYDFGIKSRKRNPKYDVKDYDMDEEDAEKFLSILKKYNIQEVLDEYPEWFIQELRIRVVNEVFDFVNLVQYSNIYPSTVYECECRRRYQNEAIAKLYNLYQWLELAGTVLPIDLNEFVPYFELIEKEIAYIKSLRKTDNRVRKKIQKKERDNIVKALNDLDHWNTDQKVTERMLDKVLDLTTGVKNYTG